MRIALGALALALAAAAAPASRATEPLPPQTAGSLSGATPAASEASAVAPRRRVRAVPPSRLPPATAGTIGDTTAGPDCPALWRRYLDSQACFEPYRLANGGLKPEAFRHCKVVVSPAPRCGSLVTP